MDLLPDTVSDPSPPLVTLRSLCERHGVTRAHLARSLGLSGRGAHLLVTGQCVPSPRTRAAIEHWSRGAIPRAAWDPCDYPTHAVEQLPADTATSGV